MNPKWIKSKACTQCKETKPVTEFYLRYGVPMTYCKKCGRKYGRNWYLTHREHRLTYAKKYIKKNREMLAQKALAIRKRTPGREKARQRFRNAIIRGEFVRPTICQECSKKRKIHAHHYLGYDGEHWKDVMWLCTVCHGKKHFKFPGKGPEYVNGIKRAPYVK